MHTAPTYILEWQLEKEKETRRKRNNWESTPWQEGERARLTINTSPQHMKLVVVLSVSLLHLYWLALVCPWALHGWRPLVITLRPHVKHTTSPAPHVMLGCHVLIEQNTSSPRTLTLQSYMNKSTFSSTISCVLASRADTTKHFPPHTETQNLDKPIQFSQHVKMSKYNMHASAKMMT